MGYHYLEMVITSLINRISCNLAQTVLICPQTLSQATQKFKC